MVWLLHNPNSRAAYFQRKVEKQLKFAFLVPISQFRVLIGNFVYYF